MRTANTFRRILVSLALGCLFTLPTRLLAQAPVYDVSFVRLPPPFSQPTIFAINDNGAVVGTAAFSGAMRGFIMDEFGTTALDPLPGGDYSRAEGINNAGQIVGEASPGYNIGHAALWQKDPTTNLYTVTDLEPLSGGAKSEAIGINSAGQIFGYINDHSTVVIWQNDDQHTRIVVGSGDVFGINDRGQIVGTAGNHAMLWQIDPGTGLYTRIDLGTLPGGNISWAQSINASGQIVGTSATVGNNVHHAVLWQNDDNHTIVDLGSVPDAMDTYGTWINDAGVILGYTYTPGYATPLIWQNGVLRVMDDLIPTPHTLLPPQLNTMNSRGVIAGGHYILSPIATFNQDHIGNQGRFSMQLAYPGLHLDGDTQAYLSNGSDTRTGDHPVVKYDAGAGTTVLRVSFDLSNALSGKWTLTIQPPYGLATNLTNIVTVDEARNPEIGVQVSGRAKVRAGFETTYQVVVTNSGNVDAMNVPVWIGCDDLAATITPSFPFLPPPSGSGPAVDWAKRFPDVSLKTGSQVMAPILIPRIPPGGTITLQFRVQFNSLADHALTAWTSPLYRRMLLNLPDDPVLADLKELVRQVFAQTPNGTPLPADDQDLKDAAAETLVQLKTIRDDAYQNLLPQDSPTPLTWLVGQATLLLAGKKGVAIDDGHLTDAIDLVFGQIGSIAANTLGTEGLVGQTVTVGDSDDPDGFRGPPSSCPVAGNWVAGDQALGYTIFFENSPNAGYPTRLVKVVDKLDAVALDLNSVSLGAISIAGHTLVPNSGINPAFGTKGIDPNAGGYHAEIALPAKNLIVHVSASLDPGTNELTWLITCTHPDGSDAGPDEGFLDPGEEGTVSFSIFSNKMNPSVATNNGARVYFDRDQNGTETPRWPNTIDNRDPVSLVKALPDTQPVGAAPSFTVSWSGSDTGVSTVVRDYTIYVSDNAGPFTEWRTHTTLASDTFTGLGGHTYRFYSLATDLTGNVESKTRVPDAQTTIPFGPYLLTLTPYYVLGSMPISGSVTLNAPARVNGLDIMLSNMNKAAKFDNGTVNGTNSFKLHIAEGQSVATFTMKTTPVTKSTSGLVGLVNGGVPPQTLTVRPVKIDTVAFTPNTVYGGYRATGTVTLEAPDPGNHATVVTFKSDNKAATVPASVTIQAGKTSATFIVNTLPVTSVTAVNITATANGMPPIPGTLTVNPIPVTDLNVAPDHVTGGNSSTGTVTVGTAAPPGGLSVKLAAKPSSVVTVQPIVTIQAGQLTATFLITTTTVKKTQTATITASGGGATKPATLTIAP